MGNDPSPLATLPRLSYRRNSAEFIALRPLGTPTDREVIERYLIRAGGKDRFYLAYHSQDDPDLIFLIMLPDMVLSAHVLLYIQQEEANWTPDRNLAWLGLYTEEDVIM